MQGGGVEKQEALVVIGFRVKPKEEAIIQDYVNRMYSQYILHPTTNQPKRTLDNPSGADLANLQLFRI